jgi:RNA polymerase subunit RPABC4/transcription elongation factor Spt4
MRQLTIKPEGDEMPVYKVQREYTNWEEITVLADSEEEALAQTEDDESLWDYAYDVNSYNYTGETWVGED